MKFKPGDLLLYKYDNQVELIVFLNNLNSDLFFGKCIFSGFGARLGHGNFFYNQSPGNLKKLFNIYTPTKKSTRKKRQTQ